jgi:hypothetical protein
LHRLADAPNVLLERVEGLVLGLHEVHVLVSRVTVNEDSPVLEAIDGGERFVVLNGELDEVEADLAERLRGSWACGRGASSVLLAEFGARAALAERWRFDAGEAGDDVGCAIEARGLCVAEATVPQDARVERVKFDMVGWGDELCVYGDRTVLDLPGCRGLRCDIGGVGVRGTGWLIRASARDDLTMEK